MSGVIVVKIGGSLLEDQTLRGKALSALAERWRAGQKVVLVHGGGKHIDTASAALGISKRVVGGLRVTDDVTLDIVVSVLAGKVNKLIISELTALNVVAAGFSGADAGTLVAEKHHRIGGVDLGNVGQVVGVHNDLLFALLDAGILPVVSTVAADANGALFNVNADAAAAAIAASLQADRLVFLTDVEGLLDENGSVVSSIDLQEAAALLGSRHVTGGMLPKLRACIDAAAKGVPEVTIAGPSRHAASLTGQEGGTRLVAA